MTNFHGAVNGVDNRSNRMQVSLAKPSEYRPILKTGSVRLNRLSKRKLSVLVTRVDFMCQYYGADRRESFASLRYINIPQLFCTYPVFVNKISLHGEPNCH